MRTVDYSDILRGTCALAGLQPGDLSPAEFALMVSAHDRRLQVAWESHRWPEICLFERRSFRPPWASTQTYAAGTVVLDLPTLQYVQALQPSTNQAPTSAGVLNEAYWAVAQPQYNADPWNSTAVYQVGDQALDPSDGNYYQKFQSGQVVVSGAGSSVVNGTYNQVNSALWQAALNAGTISYTSGSQRWVITTFMGDPVYQATATPGQPLSPANTGGWSIINDGSPAAPTVTDTDDTLPPSQSPIWGQLIPFDRYIGWEQTDATGNPLTPIGEFLFAWDRDPRVTTKTRRYDFFLSADGAQFTHFQHTLAYVWLLYRTRRPLLSGAAFDATLVYASGQQVYWTNSVAVGNFYNATGTTAAGQTPATAPTLWSQVQIPYTFRQYLIEGGYADWLSSDGQTDKAMAIEQVAEQLLELEADKLQRQSGQVSRFIWRG